MASLDVDNNNVKQEELDSSLTNKETPDCEDDANFAVICSFIEQFGSSLDLHLDIAKLKSMLETNDTIPEELVELHIKLLRKRRKYIQRDKWEKALIRFIAEYSNVDAWELERFGYKNVNLGIRIMALKNLLETQFDHNAKFKTWINALEAATLRLTPVGRDIKGNQYWFQLDTELCLRVYREEPDDENSWILICKTKEELASLINDLQSQNLDKLKDSAPASENISENEDSNQAKEPIDKIKEELHENLQITSIKDQNINLKKEKFGDLKNESVTIKEEELSHDPTLNKITTSEKSSEFSTHCNKSSPSLNKKLSLDNETNQENQIACNNYPAKTTYSAPKLIHKFETAAIKTPSPTSTKSLTQDFNKSPHSFFKNSDCIDPEIHEILSEIVHKVSSESSALFYNGPFSDSQSEIRDLCNDLIDQVCFSLDIPCYSSDISQTIDQPSSSKLISSIQSSFSNVKPEEREFESNLQQGVEGEAKDEGSEDEETQARVTRSGGKKRGRKASRYKKKPKKKSTFLNTTNEAKKEDSIMVIDQNDNKQEEITQNIVEDTTPSKTQPKGPNKRGRVKGRRISIPELEIIEKAVRSPSPQPIKRQSRRIQALQEKKNAELAEKVKREQQLLEEMAKKMQANKVKSQENSCDSFGKSSRKSNYKTEESSSESEYEGTRKKKGKRRKKKGKNGCPWDSASSSEPSEEEEEEEELEEEEDEVLQFDDNEDEFACEELEPDAEPVILKRARTAKKIKEKLVNQESSSEDEEINDDTPCQRCGKYDHPEWILLCDKCDAGFHTACLKPPLMLIPDGDWFCPPCENSFLLEKLQEKFESLSKALEKKELEEMRKQRLKQVAASFDALSKAKSISESRKKSIESVEEKVRESFKKRSRKISDDEESELGPSENEDDGDESDEGSDESDYLMLRSARSRKKISYQFTEYDELINSAIQGESYEEVPQGVPYGQSRGKDMATIEHALKQQEAEEREEQSKANKEPEPEVTPEKIVQPLEPDRQELEMSGGDKESDDESDFEPGKSRKAKKRRLNDLEPPSEDDDSDESFKGGSDTEVEDLSEESLVESLDEEEVSNDSWQDCQRSKKSRGRRVMRGSSGKKGKGKKGNYRRDGFVVDSDDSDYGGGKKSRIRSAAKKRVSYKEFTSDEETEEEEWNWKSSKLKKRKHNDSETSDDEWEGEDDDDFHTKGKKKKKNVISDEEDEEEKESDEEEDEEEDDDAQEEENSEDVSEDERKNKIKMEKIEKKVFKIKKVQKSDDEDQEERGKEEKEEKEEEEEKNNPIEEIPVVEKIKEDLKKTKRSPMKEKPSKPKKPAKAQSPRKLEMRGKPRLSKARMMNLAENSDDSQETKINPETESKINMDDTNEIVKTKGIHTLVVEKQQQPASDAVVQGDLNNEKNNPILSQMLGPRQEHGNEPQSGYPGDNARMHHMHPINPSMQMNPRLMNPQSINMPPSMPPNMMSHSGKPSALSQLTAFAAKGPGLSGSPQQTSLMNPNPVNYPSHPPGPSSHPQSRIPGQDKEDGDYSIMSLDSYGNSQRPLKPSIPSDNYFPSPSSPSQILNLESNQYNPQGGPPPHMTGMERFPRLSSNNFPPNVKGPGPRVSVPFSESIPTRNFPPRQSYPPQPGSYPPDPRSFYDPRLMRPNHINPGTHPSAHQPNSPYRHRTGPMSYGPGHGPGPGPGLNFFPQPGPGFYPGQGPPPRPGQPSNRPPHVPQNLPPSSRPSGPHSRERPPPYPGPPHLYPPGHPAAAMAAHFPPNAFYPQIPGEFLPNGGFMIQNLLHAPPPNQSNLPPRTNGMEGPVPTGSPNIVSNSPHTTPTGPPVTSTGASSQPLPPPTTSQLVPPAAISSSSRTV